jgi:hypothetical protein
MKAKGNENAEWGFKRPADGWHIVELGEGIDYLKDNEGKIFEDDKGNKKWKFPAKVNDPEAADNGADISQIVAENTQFGEQKVADILAAIGEFERFEKHFPGDRSFFEPAIIAKVKTTFAGKFLRMKTETSKDGKYSNPVRCAPMKFDPRSEDKETSAGKKKAQEGGEPISGKGAPPPHTQTTSSDDDWK